MKNVEFDRGGKDEGTVSHEIMSSRPAVTAVRKRRLQGRRYMYHCILTIPSPRAYQAGI